HRRGRAPGPRRMRAAPGAGRRALPRHRPRHDAQYRELPDPRTVRGDMVPTEAKPIFPPVNDLNRPFWDGCRARTLMLQRCAKCGFQRYRAAPVCPRCLSVEATWRPASGRGTLFSFVVFQRAYHPAWEKRVPYNVSMVELEEGPIVLTNVIGIANER